MRSDHRFVLAAAPVATTVLLLLAGFAILVASKTSVSRGLFYCGMPAGACVLAAVPWIFWRRDSLGPAGESVFNICALCVATTFFIGSVLSLEQPSRLSSILGLLVLFYFAGRTGDSLIAMVLRRRFDAALGAERIVEAKTYSRVLASIYQGKSRRARIGRADASSRLAAVSEKLGDERGAMHYFIDAFRELQGLKRRPVAEVYVLAGLARTMRAPEPKFSKWCAETAFELASRRGSETLMLEVLSSANDLLDSASMSDSGRSLLLQLYERRRFGRGSSLRFTERVAVQLIKRGDEDKVFEILRMALRNLREPEVASPEARRLRQMLAEIQLRRGYARDSYVLLSGEVLRVQTALRSSARQGSDREMLAASTAAALLLRQLAAAVSQISDDAAACSRVCESAFALTGIAFETEAKLRRLSRNTQGKNDRRIVEHLEKVEREIGEFWKTGADTTKAEATVEALQSILIENSAVKIEETIAPTITELADTLVADEVYVECLRTEPSPTDPDVYGNYILFFVGSEGLSYVAVTCSSCAIDAAIDEVLSKISHGEEVDPTSTAMAMLSGEIADHLLAGCGGAKRIILSLDGRLLNLPVSILCSSGGTYVVDLYEVVYVTSARELFSVASVPNGKSTIVAAPSFSLNPSLGAAPGEMGVTSTEAERKHLFADLPGTGREGKRIADMLIADYWTGIHASGAHVRSLRSPAVLHIATHAFYMGADDTKPAESAFGAFARLHNATDLLMRSGLALAGANDQLLGISQPAPAGDGLIFAREIVSLRLDGTILATLSACETEVGPTRVGEGLIGLRRAVRVAGAQNVIATAWPVLDTTTADFMEGLYGNLASGMAIGDAVRTAQLELKDEGHPPHHWGPFVVQGTGRAVLPSDLFARANDRECASVEFMDRRPRCR